MTRVQVYPFPSITPDELREVFSVLEANGFEPSLGRLDGVRFIRSEPIAEPATKKINRGPERSRNAKRVWR